MAKSDKNLFSNEDSSSPDNSRLHILLAEHNLLQQLFISHLLRQFGHTVTVTGDGFETLSAIQRDRCYDVLLISCHLPLMDGLKTAKFIREGEFISGLHLPIIGMSESASPEDCFQVGMDDFLRKPLQKLLLRAVLARWLREKKGRSANQSRKGMAAILLVGALASCAWSMAIRIDSERTRLLSSQVQVNAEVLVCTKKMILRKSTNCADNLCKIARQFS